MKTTIFSDKEDMNVEESKKKLVIDSKVCDARELTREKLAGYEKVVINSRILVVSPEARALLREFGVKINSATVLNLSEGEILRTKVINGPVKIGPTPAGEGEGIVEYVTLNGPVTVEPGGEETVKRWVGGTINGPVICPESVVGILTGRFTVNGPVDTYPDGCIRLESVTVLDGTFHLRARQDGKYYAARRVVALDPEIDFQAMIDKNLSFATKELVVNKSKVAQAALLVDETVKISAIPDGCSYVNGDTRLTESLLRSHGSRLWVGGDLTMPARDCADLLERVEYLQVKGCLRGTRKALDKAEALSRDGRLTLICGEMKLMGGNTIEDRAAVTVNTGLLEQAEDGLVIRDCATVTILEDVPLELLREKLLRIEDCAVVKCSPEQRPVVELVTYDVAVLSSGKGVNIGALNKGANFLGRIMGQLGKGVSIHVGADWDDDDDDEMEDLEDEIEDLEDEIEDLNDEIEDLEDEIEDMDDELEDLDEGDEEEDRDRREIQREREAILKEREALLREREARRAEREKRQKEREARRQARQEQRGQDRKPDIEVIDDSNFRW